jgi:phosphate transport system substrate-binding protein
MSLSLQVPGLPAGAELVFDINTLASIYTGAVDRWDHPAILNLNPELAGSLPNSSITVVCPNFTSEVTLIFTEAFSKVNSLFASTVLTPCLSCCV